MNEKLMNITAGLVAQGYLLELLLLNMAHQQESPTSLIETIRFQLETQLRSDAQQIGEVFPGIGATEELCAAATACLNATLDRVAGQFENPLPPKYHA